MASSVKYFLETALQSVREETKACPSGYSAHSGLLLGSGLHTAAPNECQHVELKHLIVIRHLRKAC